MLYEGTVEKGTVELIRVLSADPSLSAFRLVGGTALSLQIGHRRSIDIDLFSNQPFDAASLADHIQRVYQPDRLAHTSNGAFSIIQGVKIDMIAHQYTWLSEPKVVEGIRMATLDDIAAMKLSAIADDGRRLKDFVDISALLSHRSLDQMTQAYVRKYPHRNEAVARQSLLYHRDINFKEKVNLVKGKFTWHGIAERLKQAVLQPTRMFPDKSLSEGQSHGRGLKR